MTINQAYEFVKFVYNKAQSGYITPEQFNMLAPIMQMSLINDRLGNVKKYVPGRPQPPYGFNINQKIREELRPLMVLPTTTTVTAGVATLPADYLYYDTVSAGGKLVQEVTEDQIIELNDSLIRPPNTDFPKFVIHSNGLNVYPTSITSIKLSYVKKPTDPVWNYTMVNDEPVYAASGGVVGDGNSVDFSTGPTTHLEICNMLLSAIGVHLSMPEIAQYAEQQQLKGS